MSCNNKYIFFFLVFFAVNAKAQDLEKLNYNQIDSVLGIYLSIGDFQKGIEHTKNIKKPKAATYAPSDTIYAKVIAWRSFFYDQLGEYKQAEPLLIEAMNIVKSQLGDRHSYYAILVNNLGLLYKKTDRLELSVAALMESIKINEKTIGVEHPDHAIALNNLAVTYKTMGRYDEAEPILIEAKNIIERSLGVNDRSYASTLANLASIYTVTGRFELAEPLYKEENRIFARLLGKEHPQYVISLNNLAYFYQKKGDNASAEPLYLEVKKIYERSLGISKPEYAITLNNLSFLYTNTKRYDLAEALLSEALAINAEKLGKMTPSYARNLSTLGALYYKTKKYALTEKAYKEAVDINEKTLPSTHPNSINTLLNLSNIYQKNGKLALAKDCLKKSFLYSSGHELPDRITKEWSESLLRQYDLPYQFTDLIVRNLRFIHTNLLSDNSKEAKEERIVICDLVLGLVKKYRDDFSGNEDKLRSLVISNGWLLNSLKDLDKVKDINQAFELADENKAVLLLETFKAEKAYQMGDLPDSLIQKERALSKSKSILQAQLVEDRPVAQTNRLRELLNRTNRSIEKFKRGIEKDYPKYAALKYQGTGVQVEKIQAALDPETAMLEYVIGDSILYIFYLDQKTIGCVEHPLKATRLKRKIKKMHHVLSNYKALSNNSDLSHEAYMGLGNWFYKQLLVPVLKEYQLHENLIIITDGELGHLPFEAFLIEDANSSKKEYDQLHYLINDYNISYNYAASLWSENQENKVAKNNHQMLAMAANYEFSVDSFSQKKRLPIYHRLRSILEPLPAALEEVQNLEKEFEGLFVFGQQATEKEIKAHAENYGVIHLAMHGLLDSKRPVLSSLVFTEDGDSIENNFLQAHEISKMNLTADLVVLSACETGFGKFERGNGIASLARAFMYAGASSLIVSLWQVNDHATSEIMKIFYDQLTTGVNKDRALRAAKLTYIKNSKGLLAHPAFWSPFIQMGNTNPLILERKKSNLLWWILGGGLFVIGLFIWFKRNK